jgi:hypothetical protein
MMALSAQRPSLLVVGVCIDIGSKSRRVKKSLEKLK